MPITSLDHEELQNILFQLEQASYHHHQWYNLVIRSLVCKLPPDRHDLNSVAHKECRFGQWYYEIAPDNLHQHSGFIALGKEHKRMHALAAKLLGATNVGTNINPCDYDDFANSLERMRLELAVLQREISELLYNRDSLFTMASTTEIFVF